MELKECSIEMTGLKNDLGAMEKFLNKYDFEYIDYINPDHKIIMKSSDIFNFLYGMFEFIASGELTSIQIKIY